jgi:hypothetical protein
MYIDQLTGCCGIQIIYELGIGDTDEKEDFLSYVKEVDAGFDGVACMVTINEAQKEKWCPFLEKEGFKELVNFINPNSGSTVYVMFKEPTGEYVEEDEDEDEEYLDPDYLDEDDL